MRHSSTIAVFLVVGFAAGCGGYGGGGGGGSYGQSTAGITSGTAGVGSGQVSFLPSKVQRDAKGYTWSTYYQPNSTAGASIIAATTAPVGTDIFVGVSPLGTIDQLQPGGGQTEVTLVYDVNDFAIEGTTVYAATANANGVDAGQVFSRNAMSGQWMLAYDSSDSEAVVQTLGKTVYAVAGQNDGPPMTIAALDSASGIWHGVASVTSAVPQCAAEFGNELWIGARSSNSAGGPAKLYHGTGALFHEVKVPFNAFQNEVCGVTAIAEVDSQLYVAVEARDPATGASTHGAVFGWNPVKKDLESVVGLQNDAPSALAAVDGTLYVGTRGGSLEWLDEKGNLNAEKGLAANLGVTCLLVQKGYLFVGLRTDKGALLVERIPDSGAPAVSTTPAGSTNPGSTATSGTGSGSGSGTGSGTTGGTPTPPALSFATDMQAYFGPAGKCTVCHKAGGVQAAHPLTSFAEVTTGMSTAHMPATYVTPGNPAQSLIAVLTTQGSGSMAAYAQLSSADSDKIATWIQQGAKP